MLELFPEGFAQEDRGDSVELAAFTDEQGAERLRASFGEVDAVPVAPGWAEEWKRFHRPVQVGPLWIGPPWEQPSPGLEPAVIDPGQAFGTGAHPTTQLCIEHLLELERGSVVDVGCGSGVLAIAACRLGYGPVLAIDADAAAVEATKRNVAANAVEVDVRRLDATREAIPAAELVLANIDLPTLHALRPPPECRRLVTSGYFAGSSLPSQASGTSRAWIGPAGRPISSGASSIRLPMATFSVRFLGCKVSHADAHAVREALLRDGHEERAEAEIAVVNTCCVTNEAVRKSRQAAARAARTHSRVYVTGCAANLEEAFAGLPGNVTVVSRRSEETPAFVAGDVGSIGCVQADARLDRVRAFVRVQDGCSFSCNFCVIPLVRGASRSRRAEAVLGEVRRRVEQGHHEVVLTGINLGCFRDRERGFTLSRLVREAGATPGLSRLRLSSIEVNHVNGELVRALRETPTVSRHLHVPLQSGDDRVLRAMGRRYTSATYLRRLEPLGDFNLTTDVIVGFPAEDAGAFRRTRQVLAEAGVTKVHVFPYSPRPGTRTAAEDPVPSAVKKRRSALLRADSHDACLRRWRTKLGGEDLVLVDRPGRGYGDDYSPWLLDEGAPVGELVRVRAASVSDEGIVGVR